MKLWQKGLMTIFHFHFERFCFKRNANYHHGIIMITMMTTLIISMPYNHQVKLFWMYLYMYYYKRESSRHVLMIIDLTPAGSSAGSDYSHNEVHLLCLCMTCTLIKQKIRSYLKMSQANTFILIDLSAYRLRHVASPSLWRNLVYSFSCI